MVKSPAKWIKKILHISSSSSSSSSKIPSKDAHPDKLSKKQKKGKAKHKQNDEKLFPRDETTDQDLPISLPGQVEAVVAEEQRQPSVKSEVDANTTPELISDVILKAPTESNGGFDSPTFPDDETFSVVSKDISMVKKEVEEENEEAVVTGELKKLSLESVVVEEKKKLSLEPIVVEEQKKLSLKPVILEGQNNLSLEPIVVEEKKEAILEPVVVEEQLPVAVEEQSKISLEPVVVEELKKLNVEPVVVEEQKKLSPEPVVVKEKKELILEAVVVEEQNKLSLEAIVAEEKKNLNLEAEDEAEAVFDSKLEAPEVSIGVVDSPTFINGSLPVVTKDIPVVNKEEEEAALIIQTAFRGHIARHALKALKGLVRLQALIRGHLVRRQAATTLRCLQALVRVQARIRARRVRISEEGQAVQDRLKQRQHKTPSRLRKSEEGGYLSNSKEINKIVKQEATVRREQALASAFSRQLALATENQSSLIIDLDGGAADRSHWGWSWLERWMVARPWETSTIDEKYPPPPKEDVGDSSDMVSRSIEGGPLASSQASLDALDVDFLNQVLSRVEESSMGHVNEVEISAPISNAEVQDEQCSSKDMVENPSEICDDSIDVKECELNIHGGPSVNGDGEKNTSDNSLTVVTNSTPEIPIRAVEVVDEVPEESKVTSNKLPTDVDGECITVDGEAAKMKPILDNELGEENQPIAQTQDGNPSVVVADDIEEPCHHSNEPCISDNYIEVGNEQGSVVKGPSSKRPSRSKQSSQTQTEKAMKVNRSIKPKSGSTRQSLPLPPKETTQGERAQPRYMATTQASLAKSRFQEGISQEKEKPLKRQMSTPIHSKQIPSTPSTPRHELLRPSSSRGKPKLLPSRV